MPGDNGVAHGASKFKHKVWRRQRSTTEGENSRCADSATLDNCR